METTMTELSQPRTGGRFVSLRVKLLVAFTLLFTVIYAGTFYWFYNFASDRAKDRLAEDLTVLITSAASHIDGNDVKALMEMDDPEQVYQDERYIQQLEWLETIKEVDDRATTYTMAQLSTTEYMMLVVATQRTEPDDTAGFGETFEAERNEPTPEDWQGFLDVYEGTRDTYVILEPYGDAFGSWISGYKAIEDSQGEVVAVVGADFEADYLRDVQQQIREAAIPAFLLTYLILFVTVWALSTYMARPLTALRDLAARVGEGAYDQDFSALTKAFLKDEINTLAGVFEIMVDKVRQREETLKRKVAELKIEIDEVKQKQQVSEIVDSDFFKDLRAKATEVRRRAAQRHESTPESGESSN
jgi:HAMP domain-containing protein